MKLICKELKGSEMILNASENNTVEELKKQIERQSNIPVAQQKLLYLGKIMKDPAQLKEYKISEGAKLMLTRMPKPDLKKLITSHFSNYYDANTSVLLADAFIANMKQKLNSEYSLDDLERIATKFV